MGEISIRPPFNTMLDLSVPVFETNGMVSGVASSSSAEVTAFWPPRGLFSANGGRDFPDALMPIGLELFGSFHFRRISPA